MKAYKFPGWEVIEMDGSVEPKEEFLKQHGFAELPAFKVGQSLIGFGLTAWVHPDENPPGADRYCVRLQIGSQYRLVVCEGLKELLQFLRMVSEVVVGAGEVPRFI